MVTGYEGRRRRILVADDVAANRKLLRDYLGPLGFSLGEASSGAETLQAVAAEAWDLIVLDVRLGDRNSIEMMPELRALMARHVPVLGLSASVLKAEADEAMRAGFDAFLPKPFREQELFTQMGALLELEWCYESEPAGLGEEATVAAAADRSDDGGLILGGAELEQLRGLARVGNVRGLKNKVEVLIESGRVGGRFAMELLPLIKRYRMTEIRTWLDQVVPTDSRD